MQVKQTEEQIRVNRRNSRWWEERDSWGRKLWQEKFWLLDYW